MVTISRICLGLFAAWLSLVPLGTLSENANRDRVQADALAILHENLGRQSSSASDTSYRQKLVTA